MAPSAKRWAATAALLGMACTEAFKFGILSDEVGELSSAEVRQHLYSLKQFELGTASSFSCCAMYRDGSYFSNVTAVGSFGQGRHRLPGYAAVDARSNQSILVLGANDVRQSTFGFYARRSSQSGISMAIAWDATSCTAYNLQDPLPTMCFGTYNSFPEYISSSRLDPLVSLTTFGNKRGGARVAINSFTCMPFWAVLEMRPPPVSANPAAPVRPTTIGWMHPMDATHPVETVVGESGLPQFQKMLLQTTTSSDSAEAVAAARLRAAKEQSGSSSSQTEDSQRDPSSITLLFGNASAVAPAPTMFSFPQWCARSVVERFRLAV